jgi:phage repressor protein C with HTH and peptisase S24 domain
MEYGLPDDDPRCVLDRIARTRGVDYAALSRLVGRNAAYIQQYIKRGTPRVLPERERTLIADFLMIDEQLLGAPSPRTPIRAANDLVAVPRLDVGAAAGAGSMAEDDHAVSQIGFDQRWLRKLTASPQRLSIIGVDGDSMLPTLSHGDDIMVDSGDGVERLRDGIYVLRRDGVLLVKRLTRGLTLAAGHINIISDNAAYPAEHGVAVDDLTIVGRVVWAGRRIS